MDTDLSLIELGGEEEDETLLPLREDINDKVEDGNINSSLRDLKFSCSPLYSLRSKHSSSDSAHPPLPDGSEMKEDDIVNNKENLDKRNLLMSPNLKAGQQQMKRRKKGCGFNLRKSIAWNRAFFTEEGVLDSDELSLLSGSFSKTSSESEDKVFKELPERPSDEVHKVSCSSLLPKSKSSARDPIQGASQKLQATKGIHGIASRQGSCPLPVGSTSQKQLPKRNTMNTAKTDSKLPILSALKQDSSSISIAPKTVNMSAKHSRSSQNCATGMKFGFKGNLSNAKKTLGSIPSSAKSSVHSSLKVLANSPLEISLSANPKTLPDRKANNIGLKVAPDPTTPAVDMQPSTGHAGFGKTSVTLSQKSQYVGADNPKNVNFQPIKPSGLRMPSPAQRFFDQPKASTLHGLQCQKNTQTYSLPDANIPNLRKVGKSESIGMVTALPATLPRVGPDAKTTRTMGHLNSGCLIPSVALATSSGNIGEVKVLHARSRLPIKGIEAATTNDPVSVNSGLGCPNPFVPASSHSTPESSLELKNQYKVEIEVPSHLGSYDPINCWEQQSHDVSDYGNKESANLVDVVKPILDGINHSSHEDNQRLHMDDDMLPVQSGSSEKSHKSNDVENNHDFCPQNSYSSSSASEISLAASPSISTTAVKGVFSGRDDLNFEGTSTASVDCLPAGHGLRERSNEQLEVREPSAYEIGQTFHKDNMRKHVKANNLLGQRTEELQEENDDNLVGQGASEEVQKPNNHHHVSDVDPEIRVSGGTEFQSSHFSSNRVEVGTSGGGNVIKNPNVEDPKLESLDGDLSFDSCDRICDSQLKYGSSKCNSGSSVLHDVCLGISENEYSGNQPVLRNSFPNKNEQMLQMDDHTLLMDNETLLVEMRSSKESQQDNDTDIFINITSERKDCNASESQNAHVLSQLKLAEPDIEGLVETSKVTSQSNVQDAALGSHKLNTSENRNVLLNDIEPDLPQNDKVQDELQSVIENGFPLKVNDTSVPIEEKTVDGLKPDSVPHLNTVPFHDELLTALETAGEIKLAEQDIKGSAETSKLTNQSHVQDVALGFLKLNSSANRNVLVDDIETDLPQTDKTQDELQSETESGFPLTVNDTSILIEEKTVDGSKLDSVTQLNIIPFFDEWLAALEAAGVLKHSEQDIDASAELSKVTKQSNVQDAGLGSVKLNTSANSNVLLVDIEDDLPQNDKIHDELQSVTENGFPTKVNGTSVLVEEKTVDGSKSDSVPQLNALPFSDEWLAALEDAGEEILTRKSGTVQNSPPDKSLPEPSRWSPVKRKGNQEIGPFDCTKKHQSAEQPK